MSDNLCIETPINFTPNTLSYERTPVATAPEVSPQLLGVGLRTTTARQASPTRTAVRLSDFTDVIARQASRGSTPLARPLTQTNPLAYSAFAMLPVACNSESGAPFPTNDSGTSDGGSTNSDSGTGGDGGVSDSGTGGDGGSDTGVDGPYLPGVPETHDSLPCGGEGFLPDLDGDYGVCTNYTSGTHHLFTWDPTTAGALTSLISLSYAPDQVLRAATGAYFITNYGNASAMPAVAPGLAMVDTGMGFQTQSTFPNLVLPDSTAASNGSFVTSVLPSQPKGLVEVGERIFIATSNGVPNLTDPLQSYYLPGTVVIFNQTSGSWYHYLKTTDYNPTSIGYANDKIYVVNSGDINAARSPVASTPSSIDVIDPTSLEIIENIPLGNVGAGIHGEIAFSANGKTMVLPTGDNSGRIIVIDLETSTPREITVTTGAQVFLTGLSLDPSGRYVYVGNFNDGNLYVVDLTTDTVLDSANLDSDTTDFSGISDGLYDSMSVFMGVGPQITRVPLVTE